MGSITVTMPFDADSSSFPLRKDLPSIPGAPDGAAWVWGENDSIGRLNLLTTSRVKASAAEIQTGEIVSLNLPMGIPEQPPAALGREKFHHSIKVLMENIAHDDVYEMNTQSSTQWDGFRHFAHVSTQLFYNGATGADIVGPAANHKCSVHHWADHGGIVGRGVLLDYRSYAKSQGIDYDPSTSHAVTYADLEACGKAQGIDIRPESAGGDIKIGDIMIIRSGFVEAHYARSTSENEAIGLRQEVTGTGLAQEEEMLDWLHDTYIAAVAGDSPTFERWPTAEKYYLHEHCLSLWGLPIGELWDLEKLSQMCREKKRWTFFLTSAPANCPGGVGTPANATAIF